MYKAPNLQLGTWEMTNNPCLDKDNDYIDSVIAQQFEISGAPVNIFKMRGVHEQGKTIDLTGNGNAIASGSVGANIPDNAFDNLNDSYWEASSPTSFIGYHFGFRTTNSGDTRNDPPSAIQKHIRRINIKQNSDPESRTSQIKVERSNDGGVTWSLVDLVNLDDSDELVTYNLKESAPAQLWRFTATIAPSNNWRIDEIEMMEYDETHISNIQDEFLQENRDRDYASTSVMLKSQYDILDVSTEFAKFGIDMPTQYIFTVSFARMVELLGRPIVIGDVLELPSEIQYDANLSCVRRWLEVTDCSWSSEGFSPTWKPMMYKFYAQPLMESQETRDFFVSSEELNDELEFTEAEEFLKNHILEDEIKPNLDEVLLDEALEETPETGSDIRDIPIGDEVNEPSYNQTGLYVEDAYPPSGYEYTEGVDMPDSPTHGDYHRLTYPSDTQLPARLFQWSEHKQRWIYKETDRRFENNSMKPSIQKLISNQQRVDL